MPKILGLVFFTVIIWDGCLPKKAIRKYLPENFLINSSCRINSNSDSCMLILNIELENKSNSIIYYPVNKSYFVDNDTINLPVKVIIDKSEIFLIQYVNFSHDSHIFRVFELKPASKMFIKLESQTLRCKFKCNNISVNYDLLFYNSREIQSKVILNECDFICLSNNSNVEFENGIFKHHLKKKVKM